MSVLLGFGLGFSLSVAGMLVADRLGVSIWVGWFVGTALAVCLTAPLA